MDSHHDQVMRARAQAAGAPARRYFAYSTILDDLAFQEWRAQHGYDFFTLPQGRLAVAVDVELVFDFPSRWWGGRVAGLRDRPGGLVHGRLFEIPGEDWPIVQHKEGAITGMCVERSVRLRLEGGSDETSGTEIEAWTFTTRPDRASQEGPISTRFLEALVRGAERASLPPDYVESLRRRTT